MSFTNLRARVDNKVRRLLVENFARRPYSLRSECPYISFTFDDFPRLAFTEGGRILRTYGTFGTYYVSMGLVGQKIETGSIVSREDLRELTSIGHEVGCHTFGHLDGTIASPQEFRQSVKDNLLAFQDVVPGGQLRNFAYPLDGPRLEVKRAIGEEFVCCRGGGQTFNRGNIDLALLKSYFIDRRNVHDLAGIKAIIVQNKAARGWLIFSTHDVTAEPSPYGCTTHFFEEVVRAAIESEARVLPVGKVCEELRIVSATRLSGGLNGVVPS